MIEFQRLGAVAQENSLGRIDHEAQALVRHYSAERSWSPEPMLGSRDGELTRLLTAFRNRVPAEVDGRQCQVVEMRFFAGMSEDEIAEVLGVSARTINREWRLARAWLYKEVYG